MIKNIKLLSCSFYDDLLKEYISQKHSFFKNQSLKDKYIPREIYNSFFEDDSILFIEPKELVFKDISISIIIHKPNKRYDSQRHYSKFAYKERSYAISIKCDKELYDEDLYNLRLNSDCRKYLQLGFLVIDEYYEQYLQNPLFFDSIN